MILVRPACQRGTQTDTFSRPHRSKIIVTKTQSQKNLRQVAVENFTKIHIFSLFLLFQMALCDKSETYLKAAIEDLLGGVGGGGGDGLMLERA